jgi:hypothetical protein
MSPAVWLCIVFASYPKANNILPHEASFSNGMAQETANNVTQNVTYAGGNSGFKSDIY